MKNFVLVVLILLVIIIGGIFVTRRTETPSKQAPQLSTIKTMEITSSSFQNNKSVPKKYSCDGLNISPPLTVSNVPSAAKSLALIVSDPDAPGGDFVHWIVWNISPTTTEIAEGTTPKGSVVGKNDFGKKSYDGPCPPSGTHRYIFTLYALDTVLKLDSEAQKIDVQKTIAGHNVSAASLIGTYSRR